MPHLYSSLHGRCRAKVKLKKSHFKDRMLSIILIIMHTLCIIQFHRSCYIRRHSLRHSLHKIDLYSIFGSSKICLSWESNIYTYIYLYYEYSNEYIENYMICIIFASTGFISHRKKAVFLLINLDVSKYQSFKY